jgi:hypothetical protein
MLAAQHALGFLDQSHRHRFAALEKQEVADDVGPGIDVQLVCQPVEEIVLPRILQVEDVLGGDVDVADARAGGFELCEARQALGRRRILRAGVRGEDCQTDEKRMPQALNYPRYTGSGTVKNECRMW